jgi:Fur family transcriptional regulator, ferric uptake regulator
MSSLTNSPAFPPELQSRLEAGGLRRTLLTRAVLGVFLEPTSVDLNHPQVLALVMARGLAVDRVTLYRLLDRLVACNVLQRRSDPHTRVWRYRLAPLDAQTAPIFECDGCLRQYPLAETIGTAAVTLAGLFGELARTGYQPFSVRGTCPTCSSGSQPKAN